MIVTIAYFAGLLMSISGFYVEQKRFQDVADNWQMTVKLNMSTAPCPLAHTASDIHISLGYIDKDSNELVYQTNTFVSHGNGQTQFHLVPTRVIARIMDACAQRYDSNLEEYKQCMMVPNIVFVEVLQTLSPADVEMAWKPAGIEVKVDMHNRNRLNMHGHKVSFNFPSECDLGWAAAKTTHYVKAHQTIRSSDLPRAGFVIVGKKY
uniref:Secreted protein n=1 Tax=Steinernema glaseri TaxID=37863 RepID=A0A1I7ZA07_9BILA